MSENKIEYKTDEELRNAGFISREQYEEAVKSTYSRGAEYALAGKFGYLLNQAGVEKRNSYTYTSAPGVIFPNEISLIAGMPPVYNQQQRGTCVSMAVTALAEYYTGCTKKFSQQFLYCKCKEYEHKQQMRTILSWFKNCENDELVANLNNLCNHYIKRHSEIAEKEDGPPAEQQISTYKAGIAMNMQIRMLNALCLNTKDKRDDIYHFLAKERKKINYKKLRKSLLGIFRRSKNKNIEHKLEHWFDQACTQTPSGSSHLLQMKKQIFPVLRNNTKENRRKVYDFLARKNAHYHEFLKDLVRELRSEDNGTLFQRLKKMFSRTRESSPAFAATISEFEKYILQKLNNNTAKARREVYEVMSAGLIALQDGGTTLETAMNCYKDHGLCSYETWPYNTGDILGNEGQFVNPPETYPPEEAADEAKQYRLEDKFSMVYPPNNVEAIKAILCGTNGNRPMPVAVGMQVFESWSRSPFTKKTGWISPPVSNDECLGGHAMLIVGYKDTPKVAGGGYFLVRNSWGCDWAYGSEYAGYAKVPYQYVSLFTDSAATIIQKQEKSASDDKGDQALAKYLALAEKDMKDRNGKWTIARGSRIILDSSGIAERDTPANRILFAENGYSWHTATASGTAATKTADIPFAVSAEEIPVHQAAMVLPDTESEKLLDFAIGVKKEFLKNLDVNLKQKSRSYCFPNINLPFWTRLMPCQLRVKKIDMVADLSQQLLEEQMHQQKLRSQDWAMAEKCNVCRIYELKNGSIMFRVVAIFMTAIKEGQVMKDIDNTYIDCAKRVLSSYELNKRYAKQPLAKICIWGTANNFSNQVKPLLSHDQIEIVTQRCGNDEWMIRVPHVRAGYVWYNFLTHLLPMTANERTDFVEHTLNMIRGDRTTVPFNLLVKEIGWPAPLVTQTLAQLCREGRCSCEKGVIKSEAGKRFAFGFRRWRSATQEYFNCFISALCFAWGWKFFVSPDMSNRYQIGTIAGLALASYLGNAICATMSRDINENEKEY